MQIAEFKSFVTMFADPGTELLCDKTQIAISVNGDVITAQINTKLGDVYVDEGSGPQMASRWIVTRLARIPLLAARLRETIPATEYFVAPAVTLLPTLEQSSEELRVESDDGVTIASETIAKRSSLETLVLYVTSNAGEGKTSLINQLARSQAQHFLENKADWLLVPIPLGGRHFLRFDDITVGVMQNRYRFPFLYYQSFLALVRMGVLVPAFDGFEEMFVEGSSGEALSAMGILVSQLNSQGAMVVAARKAYFDFEDLRSQERLFDSISGYAVGFGKLELHRWAQLQFMAYCANRKIPDAAGLYQRVSERLNHDHALLTRAVLVKRLIDIAAESPSINGLLTKLEQSGADFFNVFVRGLIEREANERWLDRSGEKDLGTPLLTVDEHCDLLSQIALSMWESRIDYLKRENLEFAADYFCECARKNAFQAHQIRARIRGHAMLIPSPNAANAVEFDHDEFRFYFLGEGIAKQIQSLPGRARAEVLGTLRRGALPNDVVLALCRALARTKTDQLSAIQFLLSVSVLDAQASFTRENVSAIVIRLANGIDGKKQELAGLQFGQDALRDKELSGFEFKSCFFAGTSLELTYLAGCRFADCRFTHLRISDSTHIDGVTIEDSVVEAVFWRNHELRNPDEIRSVLESIGITFRDGEAPSQHPLVPIEADPKLVDIEKLVRYFLRSTHMSESVMRMKLGSRGQSFIDDVLPQLESHGILVEIENRGSGIQRRFRLNVSLETIDEAIGSSNGNFSQFLAEFS